MKYLFSAFAVFLAFFLQGKISILGISPDLTALLAFYAGIRYGETKGLLAGILIGALEDCVSCSIIGPNLLGKGIVGFTSSFFVSGGPLRWTPVLGVVGISLLTSVDNGVVFFSKGLFGRIPAVPSTAFFIAVMQSILNAPFGVLVKPRNVE